MHSNDGRKTVADGLISIPRWPTAFFGENPPPPPPPPPPSSPPSLTQLINQLKPMPKIDFEKKLKIDLLLGDRSGLVN